MLFTWENLLQFSMIKNQRVNPVTPKLLWRNEWRNRYHKFFPSIAEILRKSFQRNFQNFYDQTHEHFSVNSIIKNSDISLQAYKNGKNKI